MQIESQKTQLKYPIKLKLLQMDGTYNENFLKMCLHVKISPTTGRRWEGIRSGERFSIPVDQFYLLAEFFKCTPNELLNNG
ncbi:hypothetical protein [Nubsella zeaxanthinifaciens]|uniref:hypothetical protein n=1 Tax=Nubsella zeaxanthinifaciens TaxID=392412 RepID=UPI0013006280|nr:hypothetical protein [Nubsella zeaxanthinifaciens]